MQVSSFGCYKKESFGRWATEETTVDHAGLSQATNRDLGTWFKDGTFSAKSLLSDLGAPDRASVASRKD